MFIWYISLLHLVYFLDVGVTEMPLRNYTSSLETQIKQLKQNTKNQSSDDNAPPGCSFQHQSKARKIKGHNSITL